MYAFAPASALITQTHVTYAGHTAPIYGGSTAGRLNGAQQLAIQVRHARVNQGAGTRPTCPAGVGL